MSSTGPCCNTVSMTPFNGSQTETQTQRQTESVNGVFSHSAGALRSALFLRIVTGSLSPSLSPPSLSSSAPSLPLPPPLPLPLSLDLLNPHICTPCDRKWCLLLQLPYIRLSLRFCLAPSIAVSAYIMNDIRSFT